MAAERVWLVSHIAYCRMPFTIRCFYLSVLFEEPSCSDQLVTFGITRSLIKILPFIVYLLGHAHDITSSTIINDNEVSVAPAEFEVKNAQSCTYRLIFFCQLSQLKHTKVTSNVHSADISLRRCSGSSARMALYTLDYYNYYYLHLHVCRFKNT